MSAVVARLAGLSEVSNDPVLRELIAVLSLPTGTSSAGFPYLQRVAWARVRDWVPHILGHGAAVWSGLERLEALAGPDAPELHDGLRVVRQVLRTATITAPPDLWLLRQVISALGTTGWLERLDAGVDAVPAAMLPDLSLLLCRGYVVRVGTGWRWSDGATAQRVRHELDPLPTERPADLAHRWSLALDGDADATATVADVVREPVSLGLTAPPAWIATPEALELGYRLVPLLLGLRATDRLGGALELGTVTEALSGLVPDVAAGAVAVLCATGWTTAVGELTPLGRRGLQRASGPFGIIEAYHPYLPLLPVLWRGDGQAVHVERSTNVAASQDANRRTFENANDALDRFCADTGFAYAVFVEHAVGRGEATRQRWARSGDALAYVGADLEDAAIDAAVAEQRAGRLPAQMTFVRQADIGRPERVVDALRAEGLDPGGAVMLVGNGFHEVRQPTDARLIEIFRGYCAAGIVLLFTEENALAVDDLLHTAWNTYHAGFKYVHERSGQGLRPANPRPPSRYGTPLPTSWTECAIRAGYLRADAYCSRTRTIYPYTPADGHNPAISVNHFFVPPDLWAGLKPSA